MRNHVKLVAGFVGVAFLYCCSMGRLESRAETTCNAYGKVLFSLDSRYRVGQDLCEGQIVSPSASVFVACWNPGRAIWINTPEDVQQCQAPKNRIVRCIRPEESECIRLRSQYARSPEVLVPYGETLLSVTPSFKWLPVQGSDRYIISVLSKDKNWEFSTVSTNFNWPKNQILFPGQTYQVIIRAFKGNELRGSSVYALNIASSSIRKDIQKYISTALKIQPLEAQAKSVVAVYNTYNLTDESIVYLEKIKEKSEQEYPFIYRLLGDSYTQVGLLDRARANYQLAYNFASQFHTSSEIQLAKLGLGTVDTLIGNPQ